jgi:hypothetical protein
MCGMPPKPVTPGALPPEQQKWNAKARNAIIECISEDVFARIDNIDLAHDM